MSKAWRGKNRGVNWTATGENSQSGWEEFRWSQVERSKIYTPVMMLDGRSQKRKKPAGGGEGEKGVGEVESFIGGVDLLSMVFSPVNGSPESC